MSEYQGNIVIKNPATPTGPSAYGSAPGMWKLSEVAYWIKQGVWPNPAITPDQYFPYVSLLLSTTSLGNANNNLFVDSSGAFNPISRSGNATQGSATPYSTNWSNYFDGSGDFLSVPDNAALDFETGDFTVEMWVYFPSTVSSNNALIAGWTTGEPVSGWVVGADATGFYFVSAVSTVYSTTAVNTAARTPGVWHHVAVVRSSGSVTVYVNGVGGTPVSNTQNITTAATGLNIGRSPYTANPSPFTGYISNLRIVKGTAVYTSNFTPSTTPLTAISGTSLLTCQSNRFRDASTNNFTVTSNGDTRVTDYGPFSPSTYAPIVYNQSDITNWSGYFDGNADYLTIPTNAAFGYGTGDFTIEFWLNLSGVPAAMSVVSNLSSASGTSPHLYIATDGTLRYYTASVDRITSSVVPLQQWTHVALCRSSGSTRMFFNGVQTGSTYSDSNNYGSSNPVGIATYWNGTPVSTNTLFGYLSNLRILNGVGLYTTTFTPPTTNLTAISGTSLLTLQNAAFTDNSTNNFVITQYGNTTVTGNSPFNTVGYWSNYFASTNTGALESILNVPASSAIDIGAGDFTVECWVYLTATQNYSRIIQFNNTWSSAGATPLIYANTDIQKLAVASFDFGVALITADNTYAFNTWYHVAVTRAGNVFSMYINGVKQSGTYSSSSRLWATTTPTLSIGNGPTSVGGFSPMQGYVSNVRIIKGTAIYTANFTPPTTPLTAVSGTALLTCQSSRFIDNSTNALALTVGSNTSVQSFDPFYTSTVASNGGSMYFDGSGDYLSLPDNPSLQLGPSNFTVEYWWYPVSIAGYQTPFEKGYTGSGALLMQTGNGDGIIYVYASGSAVITASTAIGAGRWNHVALVRNGTSLVLYLNGVSIGSATNSTNFNNTGVMGIGANVSGGGAGAYPINGYMSDVRVTKGTALYTAAFTPPTAPVTPTAATTLLVNGMNAGIYDATTINDMETVGNAQVTTAVSKFGGASVYFDGSGDYVSIPSNNEITLGSGDFTIEFWLYLNSNSIVQILYDQRNGNGAYPVIYMPDASIRYYVNTADRIIGANLNTATWYHIAICRSGTSTRMFINGTQSGSTYTDTTNYLAAPLFLGADKGPGNFMNGYMDDLRITKGVARYTANFTPPTQAFPTY